MLRHKESIVIQNYYDLPFEEFLSEHRDEFSLSKQQSDIVLSLVDRYFGRLNRLARTRRNFANHDWSLFTDFQRAMLEKQTEILSSAHGVEDVENRMSRLRDTFSGRASDHEEAIPLLVSSYIASYSFNYWSSTDNRDKWAELAHRMFSANKGRPSTSSSLGQQIAAGDTIGGALGALGGCLGCGYISGGVACAPCAGKAGAVVGGGASLAVAWGCSLFDC